MNNVDQTLWPPYGPIPKGFTGLYYWDVDMFKKVTLVIDGEFVNFIDWYYCQPAEWMSVTNKSLILTRWWRAHKNHPILGPIIAAEMLGSKNV
jgi:hypothetical protein